MKRFAATVALSIVIVLVSAPLAQAERPLRGPVPDSGGTVPAGVLCPFPVTVSTVINRETQTTFLDAQGDPVRILVTGALFLRVTNDALGGGSTVLNVSGPYTFFSHSDGSITIEGTGPQLLGLFPTDEGGPALLYILGSFTLDVTPQGIFHDIVVRGKVEDLCESLS
jgi:hypothetical protein